MSESILPNIRAAAWITSTPTGRSAVTDDDNVVLKPMEDGQISLVPETYCPCPFSETVGHTVVEPGDEYRGFSHAELMSYYSRKR